jgi:hypothetical protein
MSGRGPPDAGESAPLFVRVAGLPADAMESFHSDACGDLAREGVSLADRLRGARAAVADRIFEILRGASPELRGALLAIKRDCFNGRPLSRRRGSPSFPELRELLGPDADRVIELEAAVDRCDEGLSRAYDRAAAREREAIGALYTDLRLRRGVTLASPGLVENLPRLDRDLRDKRQARLEASLVRYASRAALKTSPFSTLTRVGLGILAPSPPPAPPLHPGAIELLGARWQERSLVRFKRYILEQDWALLSKHPPLRDRLRVALNSSLWEPTKGRCCFVRQPFWAPQDGSMRHTPASLVQLDLGGPMIAWLIRELPSRELSYAELIETLERAFSTDPSDRRVRDTLAKLLPIGFLRLLSPWPSNEGHIEARMLEHLRSFRDDAPLAAVTGALDQIVALQSGYAKADRPLDSLHALDRLVDTLWQGSRDLAPETSAINRYKLDAGALFEDVFLEGEGDPWRAILKLSRRAADDIERDLRPLVRVAQLFSHRHDFLLSVEAFARDRWPDRAEVGLVELMRDIQPLWRAFSKWLTEVGRLSGAERRAASFNPLNLESVRALMRLREEASAHVDRCVHHGDEETRVSGEELEAALTSIPARYIPTLDACLMLQPADAEGRRWVLNQLFEGTGRYGSRYTPVMPEPLRARYVAHLAARSRIDGPDLTADFLDLVGSFGETLNVHAIQTPFALEMLDERLDIPSARKLTLGDLSVRFDDPSRSARVVDRDGRAYAPVHLGVADSSFMPFIVRLLSLFGPGELRLPALPRRSITRGELTLWPRVVLGQVVLRRRRWTFPVTALPAESQRASKLPAFAALNRWRVEQTIPERVFMIERVRGELSKPQYIDFTSPHFVQIFLSIALGEPGAAVILEEMLPAPDAALADADGRRWVVELQLETLAARPASAF